MKLVTAAQMRELDRRTIEEFGVPGKILMEKAGMGVADHVIRIAVFAGLSAPVVRLLAGRGNNGGDAFVAARYLNEYGLEVEVLLAGNTYDIKGDARTHLDLMRESGVELVELPTTEAWGDELDDDHGRPSILVDGILGTGVTGPARDLASVAIDHINALARRALVVSIDIPSGLNADNGRAEGAVVHADMTVTMGLPKIGMVLADGLENSGTIECVDIGIPAEYVDEIKADCELICGSELEKLFVRRRRAGHKGNYGHVLLIGGAQGYSGAISLAAKAALRSGSGLVTALVPESIVSAVSSHSPEIMVRGAPENDTGSISAGFRNAWKDKLDSYDAILIGPGMTCHRDTAQITRWVLSETQRPLVIDADAINVLEGGAHLLDNAGGPVVITPHPGEFARLTDADISEVQGDRIGQARELADSSGVTVVLKGAGTVVSHTGFPVHVNMTGNPGMATAGTGDVLAGFLAGLVGQGLDPFSAACAAVYLHGKAGDECARTRTQAGLIAGDIIDALPEAMQEVQFR